MMATKTFKPGEYAYGGRIKVTTTTKEIKIVFLDYVTKKSVDIEKTFPVNASRIDVFMFISDNATAYWADQVINWIKLKVDTFDQPTYW
jgi:hypothetical protein